MDHTILLLQATDKPDSKTYCDFKSAQDCAEGLIKMYEENLKRIQSDQTTITYDISQLFTFMDKLYDLACLVYSAHTCQYVPKNREWLKEQIYLVLRKQAS